MKKQSLIVLLLILSMLTFHDSYSQVRKSYSTIETQDVLYYKVEEIVKMTFGGTTTTYTVSDLSLISRTNLGPDNIRIITPVFKSEKYKKRYYIETVNLEKSLGKNQELTNLVEIKIEDSNIVIPENSKIEKIALAIAVDKLTTSEKEEGKNKDHILNNKKPNSRKTLIEYPKKTSLVEVEKINEEAKISKSPNRDSFLLTINNLTKQQSTTDYPDKDADLEIKNLDEKPKKDLEPEAPVVVKADIKNSETTEIPKIALLAIEPVKEEIVPVANEEPQKEKQDYVSINVIDVYERVAKKGYKSVYMFKEMANSYFFKKEMEKAVKWYEELFAMTNDLEPIYYYRFGEALKNTGETKRGDAMIVRFNQMVR